MSNGFLLTSEQQQLYKMGGLSLQSLFYALYGVFPNCYLFRTGVKDPDSSVNTVAVLEAMTNNILKEDDPRPIVYTINQFGENEKQDIVFCCILKDRHVCVRIDNELSECYILYDETSVALAETIKGIIKENLSFKTDSQNTVFKLNYSNGYYSLTEANVNAVDDFNVKKQYNDNFIAQDEKIRNFIKEDKKSGLVILHGEMGTGKTTYIKKLINDNPNRKFIFITSNLVALLADPSFSSFLPKLTDSVLILEDCEEAVKSRQVNGNSNIVSILLNMTDGLLSDDLSLKFICTFNEDVKNIDSALLRKGRIISKYEFEPLCKEKAAALLSDIWEDKDIPVPEITKPMTLADIYNYKEESYEIKRKSII